MRNLKLSVPKINNETSEPTSDLLSVLQEHATNNQYNDVYEKIGRPLTQETKELIIETFQAPKTIHPTVVQKLEKSTSENKQPEGTLLTPQQVKKELRFTLNTEEYKMRKKAKNEEYAKAA